MPNDRSAARAERVTETGWRIVGRAATELADRVAESPPLYDLGAEHAVIAGRFLVRSLFGSASALPQVLGALKSVVAPHFEGLAPFTREHPVKRPPERFSGLRWAVRGEIGAWTGELLWRHPHPVRAGLACTTHVIITEQQRQVALAVRVSTDQRVDPHRGSVDAGQLRPPFLSLLERTTALSCDGGPAGAVVVTDAEVDAMVDEWILADTRALPVAVLAPLESGGYAVPPEVLATELLGLAHLRVLATHPCTFRLTDALGDRRLSAYWGALRVYRPGFSCADDPTDHPLLRQEAVADPVMRAALLGQLGRHAVRVTKWPAGIIDAELAEAPRGATNAASDPRVKTAASVGQPRGVTPEGSIASASVAASVDAAPLALLSASLLTRLDELLESQRTVADELERMRTILAVRASATASVERRLATIERLLAPPLQQRDASEDGDDEATEIEAAPDSGPSLLDVVRQAAERYPDALLVLDSAEAAAQASPFVDVDRVSAVLDAMALIARRRGEGALGTSLREAFRDLGVDYRSGISAASSRKLRDQHRLRGPDGTEYECEEHIALGSSYDPRHCLRIYFTSKSAMDIRFVIGHVGRHLDVQSTT